MSSYGSLFKVIRKIKIIFTRKISVPSKNEFVSPCVYIAHHQNMFGPVNFMTFCPVDVRIWVYGVFLNRKECFKHFSEYTFMERFQMHPILSKVSARILSYLVPPLLKSMNAISVHRMDSHDRMQIFQTIEESVDALLCNERILIFPDIDYTSNRPTCGMFYSGFSRIEKLYYEKTHKHVHFIPVYISKAKRKMVLGSPFILNTAVPPGSADLKQIVHAMQSGINELAAICEDI